MVQRILNFFLFFFFLGGGGYLKFRYYQPTFQQHLEAVVSGTCTEQQFGCHVS